MTFPVTSKPTSPTVFNLQASDWFHCEGKTGAHSEISQLTSKLPLVAKKTSSRQKNNEFQNIKKKILFIIIAKRDISVYVYVY